MYDQSLNDLPLVEIHDVPVDRDGWLRYSAERVASIGMLLLLATIAAICKQRGYRMLLGASLLSASLAMALAMLSRWRRPAPGSWWPVFSRGAWGLFFCCTVLLSMAVLLAVLSVSGLFAVNE